MHVLHFTVVSAESCEEATDLVRSHLENYGDEDNWFRIGGVVRLDGQESIDCVDSGALWELPDLMGMVGDSVTDKLRIAMNVMVEKALSARLEMSVLIELALKDPSDKEFSAYRLSSLAKDLEQAVDVLKYRDREGIFEFYPWVFDKYGVTMLDTEIPDMGSVYVVMSDMHT